MRLEKQLVSTNPKGGCPLIYDAAITATGSFVSRSEEAISKTKNGGTTIFCPQRKNQNNKPLIVA
jgi:hypothetical protein|tara:strand:- start:298 stop:492 length:195 start_codon:yes stop_codon:yes gene_type:complete